MIACQLGLFAMLGGFGVSYSLVRAGAQPVRADSGCPDPARSHPGRPDSGRPDPGRPDSGRPDPVVDAPGGLRSEAGWRILADRSIEGAPGCVALVLIDPARAGSEAPIARCLLGLLRPSDPVGRYGTRQVAALVQVDVAAAGILVAERVRARLAAAGLACLVGVSISVGEGLDELLIRATSDLMGRRESAGISARW